MRESPDSSSVSVDADRIRYILSTEAMISEDDGGQGRLKDPTELALLRFCDRTKIRSVEEFARNAAS